MARFRATIQGHAVPDSAITDRPWPGRCAITGLTMDGYRERLAHLALPEAVTCAAVVICRSYGITGWVDPGYIANLIQASLTEHGCPVASPTATTPGPVDRGAFIRHLRTLKEACDHVQPLADYPGNFDAIHSLVVLDNAAKQIRNDIASLWEDSRASG